LALFSLEESGSPSAVNNPFHNYRARDSLPDELGNEQSWLVIHLGCSAAEGLGHVPQMFYAWFLIKNPHAVRDEQFKKLFFSKVPAGLALDNFDAILAAIDTLKSKTKK
jgi:hypothetical protein